MTPGIQAHRVRTVTSSIDPQPLSRTARGGKIRHKIARRQDIARIFFQFICEDTKNLAYIGFMLIYITNQTALCPFLKLVDSVWYVYCYWFTLSLLGVD